MKVVIDTNVFVSSFINPKSDSGRIFDWINSLELMLLLDSRILYEYRDVLRRPKFKFSTSAIDEFIAFLDRFGEYVSADPIGYELPDPDDAPFLEVALSGHAEALITGNKKDFGKTPKNLKIVSPSEFVKMRILHLHDL